MIGNAVTSNAARDLVSKVVESLTGEDIALPTMSGTAPAPSSRGETP
ncbi:hypothetical protein [Streptomyces adustus]